MKSNEFIEYIRQEPGSYMGATMTHQRFTEFVRKVDLALDWIGENDADEMFDIESARNVVDEVLDWIVRTQAVAGPTNDRHLCDIIDILGITIEQSSRYFDAKYTPEDAEFAKVGLDELEGDIRRLYQENYRLQEEVARLEEKAKWIEKEMLRNLGQPFDGVEH